ncbi:hypothetical protein Hanom_Chr02g00118921 [Helianthus anomalus]
MAPILAPDPLVAIPLEELPFDDLIDVDFELFIDGPPNDAHGDGELDEDVAVGLQRYAIDSDDATTMTAAPSPPHDPKPGLELNFVPID